MAAKAVLPVQVKRGFPKKRRKGVKNPNRSIGQGFT
jgi:hypothetical protein